MTTSFVVDDEAEILDLLILLLHEEGRVAPGVVDGRAALDLLAATAVNLVITNVMLPRLDGVGLVRAMRACAEPLEIPTILMSAIGRPALEGLGGCVVLSKPFDLTELLDAVSSAVSRHLGSCTRGCSAAPRWVLGVRHGQDGAGVNGVIRQPSGEQ